jgi:tetratricopeptide (TPR) repeat protein
MARSRFVTIDADDYDEALACLDKALFYLNDLNRTGYLRKKTVPKADLNIALKHVERALSILEEKDG